jgi:rhodanese-related sulfurtransferase
MKTLAAAAALAFLAALPARADAPLDVTGARTVDAQGVIALVQEKPELVILDNRRPEDFKAGHIEGAVRILDTDLNPEVLAKTVPSKTTPVLFYCNGLKCGRAAKAAQTAVGAGYGQVYYYALGMEEWNKLGLPVVK